MSKAKLKVEIKKGKQGTKVAESNNQVKVEPAKENPRGKPIYRPKAKLTTHLTINGRKRK